MSFFMNNTSVEFPEHTYFAGQMDCSYSIGFSSSGSADDQTTLLRWKAAPGYDMDAKITSVTPMRDDYLKNLNDRVVMINVSLLFNTKYPVPWPDFDAALTFAIYDCNTDTPKYHLLGATALSVEGEHENIEEKALAFANDKLAEIVKQIIPQ